MCKQHTINVNLIVLFFFSLPIAVCLFVYVRLLSASKMVEVSYIRINMTLHLVYDGNYVKKYIILSKHQV